jgi:hypothetical protein
VPALAADAAAARAGTRPNGATASWSCQRPRSQSAAGVLADQQQRRERARRAFAVEREQAARPAHRVGVAQRRRRLQAEPAGDRVDPGASIGAREAACSQIPVAAAGPPTGTQAA